MHIITGGTGNVGSAVAHALLLKGEAVTIVSRSAEKAKALIAKGAQFAAANMHNSAALHEIFKRGKTVFVLNPPADPSTDTDLEERATIASLVRALRGLDLEKIVVESTLGAQPGENIGDLGTLFELEQGITTLGIPYSIIRPAYYMSNWMMSLPVIRQTGRLPSFYPADLKIPMVAPQDIGEFAATLLTQKNARAITAVEGPEYNSASDVADAFSTALGKPVAVEVIPRDRWKQSYLDLGFSEAAAESYTRMTRLSVDGGFEKPKDSVKGKTTLQEFIRSSVGADAVKQ